MVPVLIAITTALLTAIAVGSTAIHLGDAAHDIARALARGVPQAQVLATVHGLAPDARVAIFGNGSLVKVTVTQEIDVPVPLLDRFTFTIDRSATAPRESA